MIGFLRKLWTFVRPYRGRLVLGALCGVVFALTNGALILAIKLVVNLVFGGGRIVLADELAKAPAIVRPLTSWLSESLPALSSPSSRAGLVLVVATIPVIVLLRGIFGYLNAYLMTWAGARAIADLRTRLFEHLQSLSLAFFDTSRTGDLISRVTNDTQVLYGVVANSFSSMVKDPVTIAVLVAVMVAQQPMLTGISLVVLPVSLFPILAYGRRVRRSAKAMQGHQAELASLMHESFAGNRIVKAYNLEQTVLTQFRTYIRKYVSHIMRVVRANEMPGLITEFVGSIGVALVLIYVALRHQEANTQGDFLAFILSIVVMYQPIKALTKLHNQLHQASAASHRVFELLETVTTVHEPAVPTPLSASGADVEFQNVNFAYGEKPVLHDVSLTAKAGHMVALVGSSGSGKTTLTNLLLRFYDPQRGAVRIGGTDVRQVSIKELRRAIALVAQETILFNDTVRNNIALGRPGASEADIVAAAKHAFAYNFIMEKPGGLDFVIGERGAALSVGQRQRLTIARAILKNAPILVLDEATSALDSESERAVQLALEELMVGRTTICIAHRLSTIQKADKIVVLQEGRVVEEGTHDELARLGGVYQKLYELQFRSGSEKGTEAMVSSMQG
jgi:subfamily B ATP-binding cassette protein MsbA